MNSNTGEIREFQITEQLPNKEWLRLESAEVEKLRALPASERVVAFREMRRPARRYVERQLAKGRNR